MGLRLGMVAGDHRAKEVTMRQPSVFVRQLSPAEGAQLKRIARTATQFARRQRAQILLASAAGMSAPPDRGGGPHRREPGPTGCP
jgi:CRISPR/Cas system-associated endoribonuclease Cas2